MFKTSPYRRGYSFERRVIKYFESLGYYVVRQGKSKFPDLVVLMKNKIPLFIECKVRGYLSEWEKREVCHLVNKGFNFQVAYREGRVLRFKVVKLE